MQQDISLQNTKLGRLDHGRSAAFDCLRGIATTLEEWHAGGASGEGGGRNC
jgi:hypothetical protein